MKKKIRSVIGFVLVGSLALNSLQGLEAAFFSPSPLDRNTHYFRLNQEKMRLEIEALTLQSLGSRPMLDKIPFLSRLLVRFHNEARLKTPAAELPVPESFRTAFPAGQELYIRAGLGLAVMMLAHAFTLWGSTSGISEACGDVLLIGSASKWTLGQLLSLGSRVVDIINIRGWQSGGWVSYFTNGSDLRARVKNPKRGNLSSFMEWNFRIQWALRKFLSGIRLATPEVMILHGHVRFATGSRSERREAHPHQWLKGRKVKVWAVEGDRLTQSVRRRVNTISHNGDFDDIQKVWSSLSEEEREAVENAPLIKMHGQMLSQREVGVFLNHVFHTKNALGGDSPKIAGFIDLLHAQGQWDAAARMAWALGVNQTTEDSLLTEDQVADLAQLLESVFVPLAPTLLPLGAKKLSQATPVARQQLKQAIIQRLIAERTARPLFADPHSIQVFADLAVQGFLDYDLYITVHEFMKRAIGTFGLVTTSSLAPGRAILTARKQPISIGLSKDGTLIGASSESAALKMDEFDYRIDLDMQGETAEVGIDPDGIIINLYPEQPVTDPRHMDDPIEQISQAVIQRDRLIPLRNNPMIDPLPAPQGADPVGRNIQDMAKVAYRIRAMWDKTQRHEPQDPAGFNLQTAEDFSQQFIGKALKKIVLRNVALKNQTTELMDWLVPQTDALGVQLRQGSLQPADLKEEMDHIIHAAESFVGRHSTALGDLSEEGRPIDLLVVGFEDSLWVGQQGAADLSHMFTKTRMVMMTTESSNKILKALKWQDKNPNFQYKVPGGVIDRNTIVLLVSQSGQTFPTVNSALQLMDKLSDKNKNRIFALTGELDTPLGQVLGQRYTPGAPFSRRIFLNGSGRRPAEPSDVSAMAAYATLTELLIYLADDFNRVFPDKNYDPLGLKLRTETLHEIKHRRDQWVDLDLPAIVGHDAHGNRVDSPVHRQLVRKAWRWTFHVWDTWVGVITSALYIIATVYFHTPTLASELRLQDGIGNAVDVISYLFMAAVGMWTFRWLTGRPVFVRLGGRKFFIADSPAIYQPLEMQWTKLFSRALKGLSITVHGGNPQDHFTPRLAHRAARGDLGWLGLPDARLPALASSLSDSVLSLKQFYGNVSMGNSVETLSVGHDGSKHPLFEDHISLPIHGSLTPLQLTEPIVQQAMESRFDSLSRMVAGFVFGHQWVHKVSLGGRLWNYARTQGGARVFSTASPVSGAAIVPPLVWLSGHSLAHAPVVPFGVCLWFLVIAVRLFDADKQAPTTKWIEQAA